MLRDAKVIEHLNTQLTNELTAINFLNRQFDLIKLFGIEHYIQLNAAAAPDQGWGECRKIEPSQIGS